MLFIKILEEYKCKNIKKRKTLIFFNDMPSHKKLNPIITELFIRGRKTFLLFLSHNLILL